MKSAKKAVRWLLRRFGYGVWAINSSETLNFENLLYLLFREHQRVSFLHIGAHDGKSFSDPLYHFVSRNPTRISGVLVEPVKETFKKLVRNLGHIDTLQLLNVAVHPSLKEVVIHKLQNVPVDQEIFSTGLSTLDPSRLLSEASRGECVNIVTEVAPAITLYECADHLPSRDIHEPLVICIDTEGLDFEIIFSIDFDRIKPWLLRFEHNLCDPNTTRDYSQYLDLVDWLNNRGYQVFTEHNDAVAISQAMNPLITRQYAP